MAGQQRFADRRRRFSWRVGSLVVVALLGGTAAAAPGGATEPPTDAPITSIRESLDYLMTTFHTTEAEALRRLKLQARSADIVAAVRTAVGDDLLDVWMDQSDGGRLVFLTSRPADVQAALGADFTPIQVRLVQSRFSAAELTAAETTVKARVDAIGEAKVGIDRRNETIRVRYEGTDQAVAARIKLAAGSQVPAEMLGSGSAKAGVPVVVVAAGPPNTDGERACDILACDTPMRGGVRMHIRRDDGSFGSCTAGFNVRGSNGWVYILTAGHCVTNSGSRRQYAFHNGLPLVWEKSTGNDTDPTSPADSRYFNNTPPRYDWALMPYQTVGNEWSAYWINNRSYGHNYVQSKCVSPSNRSCSSGAYAINGMYEWSQIVPGWVVCATGTGTSAVYSENAGYTPGTRCGSIQNKTMWDYYYSDPIFGWGLKVDICSRKGDSGGPLFSQIDNKAYGILSGGPPRTGGCNMSDPYEYGVFAPLSEVLWDAKYKTGITMSPITTGTG